MKKNTIEFRKPPSDLVREAFKDVDTDYVTRVEFASVAFDIEEIVDCDGREYVQVVRCMDCRHYKIVDEIYLGMGEVEEICGCTKFDMLDGSDPFGFCKWGERE